MKKRQLDSSKASQSHNNECVAVHWLGAFDGADLGRQWHHHCRGQEVVVNDDLCNGRPYVLEKMTLGVDLLGRSSEPRGAHASVFVFFCQ